ncbi:MAG: hypothetical protein RSE15_00875 [Flavobacterium sp.]|uniref:hypothetical protein n=1 Tax=Flavobacterium sp. TaxID=239 RepID=UPI002B479222|nr:hypothetical protein [Flavobacterium sp.]WRH73401.1 MAG: hypothetical protein RSE15_00875 [Flavobacterium sp.]
MALVTIFSLEGVEIEYKKDSLSLKKENNSLSSDFKVPHSQFPFLVIENDVTKAVLGPSDITSIRKNKIVPVIILENGVRYYGELQQLTVLKKFRKCNLKYGSDIIPIVNKKIAEFMPSVSVIPGETSPIPFTEESTEVITGNEYWEIYPTSMIGQIYPAVKFNFPTMYWLNKYGVGLENTDPWYAYQNHINNFGVNAFEETIFLLNIGEVDGSEVTVINKNVAMPHVFILSPLHYIFTSLGWKISGDFTTHELIKRLLMVPKKDNISKTIIAPEGEFVILPSTAWTLIEGGGVFGTDIYRKVVYQTITVEGNYKLKYSFELENLPTPFTPYNHQRSRLIVNPSGADNSVWVFQKAIFYNNGNNYIVEGEVELQSGVGSMLFIYEDSLQNMPVNYNLELTLIGNEKEFNQMHPTIELGRYVPEWTVGNYLNYIKNKFNLDITLDDFKKEITLNLNENIALNEEPAIISQSLKMTSYDIAANSSFVLKEENEEDAALFITQEEIISYDGTTDDFTKVIESKFKILPRNGYTSVLSDDINDKQGVGLIIYDEATAPFTAEATENGFNLNIPGEKGIYETFFRRWLKFMLNASNCEVTGYFTETEIAKINKAKAVYINNQRFRIIDIQTTEAANNFQEVKMRLLSVNY